MGPSKQVRHEYLRRKNFLLRVNHDNNRKKAFLSLGQLKHHRLIKTFQKPKTKVDKTFSRQDISIELQVKDFNALIISLTV